MINEFKIKKSVDYKILIKFKNTHYNVGTIIIKTYTGDILYIPSNKHLTDVKTGKERDIEHYSWHAKGQVHTKNKTDGFESKYSIIQKNGERQPISEVGFQMLLKDTIKKFVLLNEYHKKIKDIDVVFNVDEYDGGVCFHFSMVSGRLIVAKFEGEDVPIKSVVKKDDEGRIDSKIRALGHHSGSGDVALQYSLRKENTDKLKTNRQINIPYDMNISKLNYGKVVT